MGREGPDPVDEMNGTEPQSYQEFEPLPARIVGIVRAPRRVLGHVAARRRWVDALLVGTIVSMASGVALLQTAVGRQALVDQLERTAAAFGQPVDDAQYARFQEMSQHGATYAVLRAIATGPVLALGSAAIVAGLFSGLLGGRAGYTQVLAVTSHAGLVLAARDVLGAPVSYARETLASPATLTMFAPMLDEASPLARFFGAIDLFVLWWIVLLAAGVSLLYGRPLARTVLAFIGAYVGVAVLLVIAMVVSGGTV